MVRGVWGPPLIDGSGGCLVFFGRGWVLLCACLVFFGSGDTGGFCGGIVFTQVLFARLFPVAFHKSAQQHKTLFFFSPRRFVPSHSARWPSPPLFPPDTPAPFFRSKRPSLHPPHPTPPSPQSEGNPLSPSFGHIGERAPNSPFYSLHTMTLSLPPSFFPPLIRRNFGVGSRGQRGAGLHLKVRPGRLRFLVLTVFRVCLFLFPPPCGVCLHYY